MRQSKRLKALLGGNREAVEALGMRLVETAPTDQDAGSYVFGSAYAYTQALEAVFTGGMNEVALPHQGRCVY